MSDAEGDQQKGVQSSTSSTILSARHFYQHDPLLILLKDKAGLPDLWIILGAALLPGATFLIWWLSWASRVLWWTSDNTLSTLLQTFVLFPLIFLIYLLIPTSIANLFNTLKTSRVIGEPRTYQAGTDAYETFVRRMVNWTDRSWWTAAIVLIVVFYALNRLVLIEPGSRSEVPYLLRASAIFIYLPLMYATGMSVVRLLLALVFTNWLLSRFIIHIWPLHPDGSGGLGVLGRLLWLSIAIMLWEILLLSATWLARNLHWLAPLEMFLLSAIYVALTPALLIGWLVFPHLMMVRARDELLQPIVAEFQQVLMQSSSTMANDTRDIVAGTRRLTALKQRYDLIHDTFPVWPLGISSVSRVVVTAILPVLLPLLLPAIITLISAIVRAFH